MPPKSKARHDSLQSGFEDLCRKFAESNGTPLFAAVKSGYADTALQLLSKNADVNHCDINGQTVLFFGVSSGSGKRRLEMVSMLLDKRADVAIVDTVAKQTALFYAAKHCTEITGLLLERQSDACHRDKWGMTALFYSAMCSQVKSSKLLLEARCDPNTKDTTSGQTALFHAVQVKSKAPALLCGKNLHCVEQVLALADARADFRLEDDAGQTALKIAQRTQNAVHFQKLNAIFQAVLQRIFSTVSLDANFIICDTSHGDSAAIAQLENAQRCLASEHYLYHFLEQENNTLQGWYTALSCGNLPQYIQSGTVVLRVLAEPDNLIGYVGFSIKTGELGLYTNINQLLLCGRARHTGYGKQLLAAVLHYLITTQTCPAHGWVLELQCSIHNPALRWYWHQGFRPADEKDTGETWEATRSVCRRKKKTFVNLRCTPTPGYFGELKLPFSVSNPALQGPGSSPVITKPTSASGVRDIH